MKTVHTNNMVAHLWANQSQSSARNGTGSLYFRDSTIYSYGSHFPIARHVTNERGESAILFTTRDYSVTTAHHLSLARNAIAQGERVFHVNNPSDDVGVDEQKDYAERVAELLLKARRATKYAGSYAREATELFEESVEFAKFFGLPEPTGLTQHDLDELEIKARVQRAANILRQEQEQAKRIEQQAARFAQWLAGENVGYYYFDGPVRLRAHNGELQTSRGASVPLETAHRAFLFIKAKHDKGEAWTANGHSFRVGHFNLERIDEQGNVKIGCHDIEWAEIERFAISMGWDNARKEEEREVWQGVERLAADES